jgi:peptidoglycan/LPS O-acetylase OafA/YrhL
LSNRPTPSVLPVVDPGWRLGHRPSLDAVRGVAVLLVLAGHFGVLPGSAAAAGVALFFTLSGYLITALLLGELAERGRVDLAAFYARRARRLLPALAMLVAALAATAWIRGGLGSWLGGAWPVALYAGNWAYLAGSLPPDLWHTWSLAIEEQFYILWPAALLLLWRRPTALPWTVLLAVLSAASVLPWLGQMGPDYYGSPERAQELLAGALLAMWAARRGRDWSPRGALALLAAAVLAWACLDDRAAGLGTLALTLPLAVVVAWAASRPRTMAWRPLTGTGRISYGLYLYHYPLVGLAAWPVLLAATYALAGLSWLAVERRFLAGRRPAEPAAARQPTAMIPAGSE